MSSTIEIKRVADISFSPLVQCWASRLGVARRPIFSLAIINASLIFGSSNKGRGGVRAWET